MNDETVEAVEFVEEVADALLSGTYTLELTAWDDGDFQVVAFHTIGSTYPDLSDPDATGTFYRERLLYSTSGDFRALSREVVRRECGRTGSESVWSELLAGGTDDYDAPSVEDYEVSV